MSTRAVAREPSAGLLERLSLAQVRRDAIERLSSYEVRWRALGALFVAGGALALVSLALPLDHGSQRLALGLVCLTAIATGAALMWSAERLPATDLWLSILLAFGTVLITLGIVFNRVVASPYALIYVWVGFDGFFFLSRRAALANVGWLGVNYAVALAVVPSHHEALAGRWLLMMGTVSVIGLLADVLRSRAEVLIGALSEVARTDPLTGLLNRRGFEERLEDELARARRTGAAVGLVVCDLDRFKLVNDRYGHHVGDEALRRFGELLVSAKRTIDGAARIGGEEFALILPSTDHNGGRALAERIRRGVREALTGYGLPLSVSLGVVSHPAHGEDAEALLRRADQAMYTAKRLGRDRAVIYSAELGDTLDGHGEPPPATIEQLPAVLILAETLDLRDTGTALHSQTVGRYAEMIAAALGLEEPRVKRIRLAGLLHDIGKIGVPDHVLRKAGPLEPWEWEEMRKHPELGARIISAANLEDISGWVLAHHERPDGTGYPSGLCDEEIPLEAKILSVADAFEAMTAERVYSPALSVREAVAELERHAGTQFDRGVVAVFLACLGAERPAEDVPSPPRAAG